MTKISERIDLARELVVEYLMKNKPDTCPNQVLRSLCGGLDLSEAQVEKVLWEAKEAFRKRTKIVYMSKGDVLIRCDEEQKINRAETFRRTGHRKIRRATSVAECVDEVAADPEVVQRAREVQHRMRSEDLRIEQVRSMKPPPLPESTELPHHPVHPALRRSVS